MTTKQILKIWLKTPTKQILKIWLVVILIGFSIDFISSQASEGWLASFPLFLVSLFFLLLVVVLPWFLLVRWIADSAEKAGYSRKVFIVVSILWSFSPAFSMALSQNRNIHLVAGILWWVIPPLVVGVLKSKTNRTPR